MKFFVDTNIIIYLFNGRFPHLDRKFYEIGFGGIAIPAIVVAELYYGAEKSMKREINLAKLQDFLPFFEIIHFDEKAAEIYGRIRTALERQGKTIGWNDLMIAATVLAAEGVLVTHNVKEFERIKELQCVDWTES